MVLRQRARCDKSQGKRIAGTTVVVARCKAGTGFLRTHYRGLGPWIHRETHAPPGSFKDFASIGCGIGFAFEADAYEPCAWSSARCHRACSEHHARGERL